jgi:hypothetical protein
MVVFCLATASDCLEKSVATTCQCGFLSANGFLLLEHGYNQQLKIVDLLTTNFTHIQTFKDYNSNNRAVLAQLKPCLFLESMRIFKRPFDIASASCLNFFVASPKIGKLLGHCQ